MMLFVSMKALW